MHLGLSRAPVPALRWTARGAHPQLLVRTGCCWLLISSTPLKVHLRVSCSHLESRVTVHQSPDKRVPVHHTRFLVSPWSQTGIEGWKGRGAPPQEGCPSLRLSHRQLHPCGKRAVWGWTLPYMQHWQEECENLAYSSNATFVGGGSALPVWTLFLFWLNQLPAPRQLTRKEEMVQHSPQTAIAQPATIQRMFSHFPAGEA